MRSGGCHIAGDSYHNRHRVEPYETHLALATALAIGLLSGSSASRRSPSAAASFGGIRTYPIFALVGALATLLEPASMWLPLVALLGVFALVAISYAADIREQPTIPTTA